MQTIERRWWQRAAKLGLGLNLLSFLVNVGVFLLYQYPSNLWMLLINAAFVALTLSQIDSHPKRG